jgi:DNA-binding response OmpR family regulator
MVLAPRAQFRLAGAASRFGGWCVSFHVPLTFRRDTHRVAERASRVLVVEDDQEIACALAAEFTHAGYQVRVEGDGVPALAAVRAWDPDLVVLDLRLPVLDGLAVCRRLRADSDVPIVMLTARDAVSERVEGLDAGADDYLTKPFSLEELLARVRAALRRSQAVVIDDRLVVADLVLDTRTRDVVRGGRSIELTPREFDLLAFLMRHPGNVLSRQQIFAEVWGYDFLGHSNVIDVYIRSLRRKIESASRPALIRTVRGVGYALRPPR